MYLVHQLVCPINLLIFFVHNLTYQDRLTFFWQGTWTTIMYEHITCHSVQAIRKIEIMQWLLGEWRQVLHQQGNLQVTFNTWAWQWGYHHCGVNTLARQKSIHFMHNKTMYDRNSLVFIDGNDFFCHYRWSTSADSFTPLSFSL